MTSVSPDISVARRESRDEMRVVSAKRNTRARLREIWQYRELWRSLVRKELKVKYKDSILGFAWTLLNPTLRLGIFYFVFQIVFPNGIPLFAIFFLSGLIVWNLFNEGLAAATGSVVGNGALVKKVSFPREILPLAAVGASVVNFFLQLIVLLAALAAFQHAPSFEYLPLIIPALIVTIMLTSAVGILLSALNVQLRDIGHFLEMGLLLWFWATPIVYPAAQIFQKLEDKGLPEWLYMLNPLVPVVMTFQRAIHNTMYPVNGPNSVVPDESILWYLGHLGLVGLFSVGLFFIAMAVFARKEGNFAEEL